MMMMRTHTDRAYQAELDRIRDRIAAMGGHVEAMIGDAVAALAAHDVARATRVIERDRLVDALEVEVDELCVQVIARRQPAASDLRFLAATLKLVVDIERIGDLAVNVCKKVRALATLPGRSPAPDLGRMAAIASGMVSEALTAYVRRDAARARTLFARDNSVDALHAQAVRELEGALAADLATLPRVTRLLSIAGYLERVGDHAMKLAQQVVFLVEGDDVRHKGLGKPKFGDPRGETPPTRGVLFVGAGTAGRAPIAEGWARRLAPEGVAVAGVGLAPGVVHPLAVRVMAEVGIDIAATAARTLADVRLEDYDTVVTLTDEGAPPLALPPGTTEVRWPLASPPREGEGPEALEAFRRVRDHLARLVERLFRTV
jgi:phosphate transport system protein